MATGLTFAQPADGTTSMTIDFSGSLSSYVIDFGGYGDVAPSEAYYSPPNLSATSPAPTNLITDQEFTYTNGDVLKDEYVFNPGTMLAATASSETLIGNGTFAGMMAGGSLDTLIDLSGTNSKFENVNHKSVTEEALNGEKSTKNVFLFGSGTNVLIGDLGHNTFVENLSAANAVNIIYGGGGVSTYELSGTIDILYTHVVPTPEQIESLNPAILADTLPVINGATLPIVIEGNEYPHITYLIDPAPQDVIEFPSLQPTYVSGFNDPQFYGTTSSYSSVAGTYSEGTLTDGFIPFVSMFQGGNTANFTDYTGSLASGAVLVSQAENGEAYTNLLQPNYIVNDYLPKGFGASVLENSNSADQKFISLPAISADAAITLSPPPRMEIVRPTKVAVAEFSLWMTNAHEGFLHQMAEKMGILGVDKIHPALGLPPIDYTASLTKWLPSITIQS